MSKAEFSIYGPIACASSEAEERVYKLIQGKRGRWLVAVQPNEADNIYFEDKKDRSGFAGRKISLKLNNGESVELVGPWKADASSLYSDTGYDCRDKHLIKGIVALKRENAGSYKADTYEEILFQDEKPVVGLFNRVEIIAQEWAEKLSKPVFVAYKSYGGGCASRVEPTREGK